jgi:uncharacterized repeat protein (TIGR03803 family)
MLCRKPFSLFKKLVLPAAFAALPLVLSGQGAQATTLTVLKDLASGSQGQQLIEDPSGNFFGLTFSGGANGHGEAFKLAKQSGGGFVFVDIYDFCPGGVGMSGCSDGSGPEGRLILDTSGNLYGATAFGGAGCAPKPSTGCGTIFKLSPSGAGVVYNLNTLWSFCVPGVTTCPLGAAPGGGVTYLGWPGSAYDGTSALFGSTTEGGSNTKGIVYRFVPGTPSVVDLHDFCGSASCSDGSDPDVPFLDASGNIYGVTHLGGNSCAPDPSGCGLVYEMVPAGGGAYTYSVLYSFCPSTGCADGQTPNGQLVMNAAGTRLFGETTFGGANNGGTVFRVNPSNSTEVVRYSFCTVGGAACTDGDFPHGGLWQDSSGNLYGTTAFGGANHLAPGGTVFKLNGTTLTTLYSFCPSAGCADGNLSQEGVVREPTSGDLFGITSAGGANGGGTVFDLTP